MLQKGVRIVRSPAVASDEWRRGRPHSRSDNEAAGIRQSYPGFWIRNVESLNVMDEWGPDNRLSDQEYWEVFTSLFPNGLEDPALLRELAPAGWDNSPLRLCFHPTPEQLFEESLRLHENLKNFPFRKEKPDRELPKPPTIEEIRSNYRVEPGNVLEECADLIGLCLWDIFSDNHEVISPDGRTIDIGSFRGAAGFIAEFRHRPPDGERSAELDREDLAGLWDRSDYMEFYLGTIWISGRADLTPVYELIFRRLRERGLNWRYVFPRLHLIELTALEQPPGAETQVEWGSYDPSESIGKELEASRREQELAQMRQEMEEAHREAIERARNAPPPRVVGACKRIYGQWPQGWPASVGAADENAQMD